MKYKKVYLLIFLTIGCCYHLISFIIYHPPSKRVCPAFKIKQEITSFKHISKPCLLTIIKAFCFAPVTNKPNDLYSFTNHKWYFKNNNLSKIFWKPQNNEFYNSFFFKKWTLMVLYSTFLTPKSYIFLFNTMMVVVHD